MPCGQCDDWIAGENVTTGTKKSRAKRVTGILGVAARVAQSHCGRLAPAHAAMSATPMCAPNA